MAITVVGDHAVVSLFISDGLVVVEAPPFSHGTDTSNAFDGLDLGGFGICLIEPPLASPPAALTGAVEKAIPLPLPTLVKGRPT